MRDIKEFNNEELEKDLAGAKADLEFCQTILSTDITEFLRGRVESRKEMETQLKENRRVIGIIEAELERRQ